MAESLNDIKLRLESELDLETKKFTTKHSKAMSDAINEAQRLINQYKTLQQEFSNIPQGQLKKLYRQFELGSPQTPFTEKAGTTYYSGIPLLSSLGTPYTNKTDIIIAARRQREVKQKEIKVAQQAGAKQINRIETLGKEESFSAARGELEKLFTIPKELGGFGRNLEPFNKALITAGKNAGMSRAEIEKFIKTGMSFNDHVAHMGSNMARIGRRALETVPIWMALRTVIQGTIQTIQEGIKSVIDLDRELARIKTVTNEKDILNLGTMSNFIAKLNNDIRNLSIETGISTKEIAQTFYSFKDAGLSSEVAIAGMNVAVKGSIALFGDALETAKNLTDIYVQMGDKIKSTTGEQGKMEQIMATIVILQKTNKFELSEFNEALKNFIGEAANANLTLDQMAFLLAKAHNFMQRGGRGGTELRRAFEHISISAKEAGIILDDVINLNTTSKFDIMIKVIEHLNKKLLDGQDIAKETHIIFGEIGGRVIKPLIANAQDLGKEFKELSELIPERRMEIFKDTVNDALLTIHTQLERLQRIKEQLGSNFLAGIFNIDLQKTRDAAEVMSKINDKLKEMIPVANNLGKILKDVAIVLGVIAAIKHPVIALSLGTIIGGKALDEKAKTLVPKMLDKIGFKKKIAMVFEGKPKNYTPDNLLNTSNKPLSTTSNIGNIASFYEYQNAQLKRGELLGKSQLDIEKERLELMEKFPSQFGAIEIRAQKIKIIEEEINEELKDYQRNLKYKELSANLSLIYGKSEIDIQREIVKLHKDTNKQKDEELKLQGMINDELIKYASSIEKTLSGSIKNIMSGTAGLGSIFTDLNNTMVESYRTVVSDELAKGLMSTGIGAAFGESMISLQGGIKEAHKTVYEWITKAHKDGINEAKGGSTSPTAGYTGTGGIASVAGGIGTNIFSGDFWNQPSGIGSKSLSYVSPYAASKGYKVGQRVGGLSRGQVAGMGVQTALTGYSTYQSAMQGGAGQGRSIASGVMGAAGGALAGIGMLGIPAMEILGLTPIGWALAAGLLIGSIVMGQGKKSKQNSVEVKTSENKISSKIDVTNKNLEVINRNMIGLRQDIRTFILPQSAYFSEKDSLEEEFSLSSRRGLSV